MAENLPNGTARKLTEPPQELRADVDAASASPYGTTATCSWRAEQEHGRQRDCADHGVADREWASWNDGKRTAAAVLRALGVSRTQSLEGDCRHRHAPPNIRGSCFPLAE